MVSGTKAIRLQHSDPDFYYKLDKSIRDGQQLAGKAPPI